MFPKINVYADLMFNSPSLCLITPNINIEDRGTFRHAGLRLRLWPFREILLYETIINEASLSYMTMKCSRLSRSDGSKSGQNERKSGHVIDCRLYIVLVNVKVTFRLLKNI